MNMNKGGVEVIPINARSAGYDSVRCLTMPGGLGLEPRKCQPRGLTYEDCTLPKGSIKEHLRRVMITRRYAYLDAQDPVRPP
jgi:hypothetical protein